MIATRGGDWWTEIFGGMKEDINAIAELEKRTNGTAIPIATDGEANFDASSLDAPKGSTVAITHEDWQALNTESKHVLFASYNVFIPRGGQDPVWKDVKSWEDTDALEGHVPLHTQHCVQGTCHSFAHLLILILLSPDLRYVYSGSDINDRMHRCSLAQLIDVIKANRAHKISTQVLNMLDIPLSSSTSSTV